MSLAPNNNLMDQDYTHILSQFYDEEKDSTGETQTTNNKKQITQLPPIKLSYAHLKLALFTMVGLTILELMVITARQNLATNQKAALPFITATPATKIAQRT